MYNVTLVCVGKLKEKFYSEACEEYCKRLSRSCKLHIVELKEERLSDSPSQAQIDAALAGRRCHPCQAPARRQRSGALH